MAVQSTRRAPSVSHLCLCLSSDWLAAGTVALQGVREDGVDPTRRALPLQVFFTCRACGIKAMCRACAYVCHLGHCVELIVNHGELTCECGVAGGFEWALACDVRIAGTSARFWLPETQLGLIPAAGGCTRRTELIGAARAKQRRKHDGSVRSCAHSCARRGESARRRRQ